MTQVIRVLVCVSVTACAFAVAGAARLTQNTIDYTTLLGGGVPDDPFGRHGAKHVSGYYRLNRTEDAEMFYFYFESRKDPANDPVVLWMTGGPGCSSELAVFYENGPYRINEDLTLSVNKHGWDNGHNLIFVDQPIGTGFSYSDSPKDVVYTEQGVANDMLDFMLDFFDAHPELADNDLYITGESYAGHYVPAVTHKLWQWSKEQDEGAGFNIQGLAIGNGLTDPAVQYGAYGDYAYKMKLISKAVRDRVARAYPACKYGVDSCNQHDWSFVCKAALTYCQAAIFGQVLFAAGDVNVYDIRKQCVGPLCYDFSRLNEYLGQEHVRAALGVGDIKFKECDTKVHDDLMGDWMLDYAGLLPNLLDHGVRVMIYAGDQDLICNWLGNRRWVDQLDWRGSDAWAAASDAEWAVHGKPAGSAKQAGGMTFVKVYDAGHMVPMDQSKNSLAMLQLFTSDGTFAPERQAGPLVLSQQETDPSGVQHASGADMSL